VALAAGLALGAADSAIAAPRCCVSVLHAHAGNASTAKTIRLAEAGNARYQAYLGYMYETGRGVPQDYFMAAKWYHRAAAQGDVRGQHLLGLLYDKGFGVPESYVEAHKWSNLAAARAPNSRDREYFARIRDALTTKMTLGEIAEAQRRARYFVPVRER
jgi:TPR repeat protein